MYEPARREGSFEMAYTIDTEGIGYEEAATSSFDQGYLQVRWFFAFVDLILPVDRILWFP